MRLLGRKALVTGAAQGIGRGCAIELARAGADVVINDRQASSHSEDVLNEIASFGRRSALVEGDAFARSSCDRIVQAAVEQLGRIDLFVSNPAFSKAGKFLDYDAEMFERTIAGTLTGGFHMSQLVARQMVAQGGRGKIVFISSVHARTPYAGAVAYNAAKAGLNHMAFTIAGELLPHRINVNVIEPGWIDTPGEHKKAGTAAIQAAGTTLPWGRIGTPEDIGRAAVFLCSDDADYVTGSTLLVDGGYWLRAATTS